MELQEHVDDVRALDAEIIAIAQLEKDPAMLERIERFVGPGITIVADPEQVSREPFEIFDVYIAEDDRLVTRIRGSKEARPRPDLILAALRGEGATAADQTKARPPAAEDAGDALAVHLRWMWSHPVSRAGDPLKLALLPTVADGWHVYGPGSEITVPLSVQVEVPDGLVLTAPVGFPPPVVEADPVLQADIPIYRRDVPLDALTFAVADDAGPGTRMVRVTVGWQACDDSVCLPPTETVLELPVEIVEPDVKRGQMYGWETW